MDSKAKPLGRGVTPQEGSRRMFAIYKISDPHLLDGCSNGAIVSRKNIRRDTEGGRPRLPIGFGYWIEWELKALASGRGQC